MKKAARLTRERKRRRGHVDRTETFDEFLAKDGLLAETEKAALREIAARKGRGRQKKYV
jgi:hypothetical protein